MLRKIEAVDALCIFAKSWPLAMKTGTASDMVDDVLTTPIAPSETAA
jgi:hypothetical protein